MRRATATGAMKAAVDLDRTALAIHIARTRPIGERMIRAILVASFRHQIEEAIDAEEILAAAPEHRVGVEDFTRVVFEEDAVAGKVRHSRVALLKIVVRASGCHS